MDAPISAAEATTDDPLLTTPPAGVLLDFDPKRDGFSFANHFEWTDPDLTLLSEALRPVVMGTFGLSGAALGLSRGSRGVLSGGVLGVAGAIGGASDRLVRSVATRWPSFGLCGGMALAAVERWPAKGRVATSDLKKELIRPLLRRRQEATLRAGLARFAAYWSRVRFLPGATPDAPFARLLTRELDRIEARVREGRPVVLGLVGDAPDPFALHQVVAYGLDRTGPLTSTVTVYDPNRPGQSGTIQTAPSPATGRTRIRTDLTTGPRPSGRCHVSTRPGHLSHIFAIEPRRRSVLG